ncbi:MULTISPECIES: putative ATP-grasp-modified RiPP [unclassified Streptomyces]|uniref:putative ATP-grasp-modified RiPP n=1 Tax=unclassified Streptomyces TaxID=2593676 RepID=UPI003BB4F5AD
MFNYAERIPTGTPLPQGHRTPRPWGTRRFVPYPVVEGEYTRVEIDPATQTGRYFNAAGVPVASPGHGTSSGTNPSTGTSPDGQGGGNTDSDTGNDTDQ